MLKKKLLSCLLVLSIALAFIPLATVNTYAASSGPKTFIKTKTVTIKPGKTYKTPKFKLTKKMAFQFPIKVWLSPKDNKDPDYITNGSYKLTLKTAKGKTKESFTDSLEGVCKKGEGECYDNWIYIYNNSPSDPGYAKGTYYFTIKNTTKRTIRVTYSVRGYTKLSSEASFPKSITLDGNIWDFQYIGKIGSGLPAVESVKCSSSRFGYIYHIEKNGKFYLMPWEAEDGQKATFTVKLANRAQPYKFKVTVKY